MGPKWVIFVARPIHQWAGSFRVRRPEFPVHHRIVSVPGTKCHSQHALVKASAPNRIVARFAERRYLRLRIATGIARQVGNFPFPTGCAPRLCLTVTAPLTSSSASTSLSMCQTCRAFWRKCPVCCAPAAAWIFLPAAARVPAEFAGLGPAGLDRHGDLVFGLWPRMAVIYAGSGTKFDHGYTVSFGAI